MRVTQFMIYNQTVRSIQRNLGEMSVLHNRLSSGKKIDKPSDDIMSAVRAMDYRLSINSNDQYRRNINEAVSHLRFTENVISSVSEAIIRLKELAIQGLDGALNAENRAYIAKETVRLTEHLFSLSNSKFRDRYIFSGFRTDMPSFSHDFSYQGDSGMMNVMIDRDAAISVNIAGNTAFQYNGESFMKIADDLRNALMNNDIAALQTSIGSIDGALGSINAALADIGARLNRLDDQINRLESADVNLKSVLSSTEDADFVETASDVSKVEFVLQALRQTASRTLSQSLFDFLR